MLLLSLCSHSPFIIKNLHDILKCCYQFALSTLSESMLMHEFTGEWNFTKTCCKPNDTNAT